MSLSKYVPTTRVSSEKLVLRNSQFARWLSKRTGASHTAVAKAIQIISKGIVEALANGYDVNLYGLGVFETRELKPRLRYHRLKKTTYMSEPSTIVHFRKSEYLTKRVRQLAAAQLEAMLDNSHVTPIKKD
jgi:nucleoid DNA-binding protein